ncbi:hypothetical protein [Chitinimonas sp.]|uniref:hypothetical protein n=1 Tax=Chitinimonas sp. TaxID=1934313 RepID=UPI0035AEAAD9
MIHGSHVNLLFLFVGLMLPLMAGTSLSYAWAQRFHAPSDASRPLSWAIAACALLPALFGTIALLG